MVLTVHFCTLLNLEFVIHHDIDDDHEVIVECTVNISSDHNNLEKEKEKNKKELCINTALLSFIHFKITAVL